MRIHRLRLGILNCSELGIHILSLRHRRHMGHTPGMGQQLPLTQPKEIIELADPILHSHRLAAAGLEFGKIEIGGDDQV